MKLARFFFIVLAAVLIAVVQSSAYWLTAEEGFGHLRGRFVYDGEPPAPKLLTITGAEREELEPLKLVDESLVVDVKNRGLANVVVVLYVPKDEAPPPMHPAYRIASDTPDDRRTRTMSMLDTRYVPHVLLVRTDEIYLASSDTQRSYNPKLHLANNHDQCPTLAPGSSLTHEFRHRERRPALLSDSIYPWMRGWIVIQDHPYMAISGADGHFEIRHIPVGERTFRFWHERSGHVASVTIDGARVEWEKGLARFGINAGEVVDLGDVKVPPSEFEDPR
jgi:hypothetical protein